MTAQIWPDDVTAFLDGATPPVLRLSCPQPPYIVNFVRSAPMSVAVKLPLVPPPRDDLFDIHKALAHPYWSVKHLIGKDDITLFSLDRSGFRKLVGIATLHLGWNNDDVIANAFVNLSENGQNNG